MKKFYHKLKIVQIGTKAPFIFCDYLNTILFVI